MDRCAAPWLAVAMHRPMYVVFPHKSNRVVGEHLRASLEDLFEAYQVSAGVATQVVERQPAPNDLYLLLLASCSPRLHMRMVVAGVVWEAWRAVSLSGHDCMRGGCNTPTLRV